MLQSMGLQRVRQDLATEQQEDIIKLRSYLIQLSHKTCMPGVLIKRGKFVHRDTDTRRGAHVKLKVEIGMMQLQAKCLSLFRLRLINHRLVVFKQQEFISHTSGGWKFKTKVSGWSGKGTFLVLRILVASSHGRRSERALLDLSYKVINFIH